MTINSRFPLAPDQGIIFFAEVRCYHIDHIITPTRQLDLGKIVDQMVIATMCIDKNDLLESVAGDLAANIFKQAGRQIRFKTDATEVVSRFQDLSKDEIRKDNRRLQGGGAIARFTPNEHVSRKRQMMSMPLDAG